MASITGLGAPSPGLASVFINVLVTHGNPVGNIQHYELWVIPFRNVTINGLKHPWESRQSFHTLTVRTPETQSLSRSILNSSSLWLEILGRVLTCDGINRVWRSHASTNVIWTSVWLKVMSCRVSSSDIWSPLDQISVLKTSRQRPGSVLWESGLKTKWDQFPS